MDAYEVLRRSDLPACHRLHYLQMVLKKLAKSYLASQQTLEATHVVQQFFGLLGRIPKFKSALWFQDTTAFRLHSANLKRTAAQIEVCNPR
jgi:hypothetical protein